MPRWRSAPANLPPALGRRELQCFGDDSLGGGRVLGPELSDSLLDPLDRPADGPAHERERRHQRHPDPQRRLGEGRHRRLAVGPPFEHLLELHAGLDMHLRDTGHRAVEQLLNPVIERNWDALPFGRDKLGIPAGFVTNGGWKAYRKELGWGGKNAGQSDP